MAQGRHSAICTIGLNVNLCHPRKTDVQKGSLNCDILKDDHILYHPKLNSQQQIKAMFSFIDLWLPHMHQYQLVLICTHLYSMTTSQVPHPSTVTTTHLPTDLIPQQVAQSQLQLPIILSGSCEEIHSSSINHCLHLLSTPAVVADITVINMLLLTNVAILSGSCGVLGKVKTGRHS